MPEGHTTVFDHKRHRRWVAWLGFGCAWLAVAPVVAESLAPHRAVYALSRHESSRSGDVASVAGRMALSIEASCDGWHIEQVIGFRIYEDAGETLEHAAHLSGWESASGLEYWFSTRTYEDRVLVEEVGGVARRGRDGAAATTRFSRPRSYERTLPETTVFPTAHIGDLIEAARQGTRQITRTVFDGTTEDSPFEVSAFIGQERPLSDDLGDGSGSLARVRSWPMRLAYFKVGALEPTPEFEMSTILYENGVAGDMIYDYGDFALDVRLTELELLMAPLCP